MVNKRLGLLLTLISLSGFSGFNLAEQCFLGGGLVANWLLNEPRPVTSMLDDFSITHQISKKIAEDTRFDHSTNIIPISYHQTVLLIGQVPTQTLKTQVYDYASRVPKVNCVFNQITLDPPTQPLQRIKDMALRCVIRAKLVIASGLRHCHFKVHTDNQMVFILGKANCEAADIAVSLVQNTKGVRQVTRLITLTD